MKLIVHELTDDGLIQELRSPKNVNLYAVRPHIYRHNFAEGSLKIQILDAQDNLLSESESVEISDIGSQNFFHGYVRFLVSTGLKKNEVYKIKLIGENGYSFSESAYVGICNDYDLSRYSLDYEAPTSLNRPFDIEIWERKTR